MAKLDQPFYAQPVLEREVERQRRAVEEQVRAMFGTQTPAEAAATASTDVAEAKDAEAIQRSILAAPVLPKEALLGILGEITAAGCANTEATATAMALHVLGRFTTLLGRAAYIPIGDQQRALSFFALVVGPTSHGRKGTSEELPARIFKQIADSNMIDRSFHLSVLGSLATGEGLIHQVRDCHVYPAQGRSPAHTDPGVEDKRLFLAVSEFAGPLAQFKREGSTLSAVLRDAFDGKVLTIPTKTSFNRATGAHIVCVGSVPETEIAKELRDEDKTNGVANRFLMAWSARSKLVPLPPPTDPQMVAHFAERIAGALRLAWARAPLCFDLTDPALRDIWAQWYHGRATRGMPDSVAKLTARAELFARIFAALIALINGRVSVTLPDLQAAFAWVDYWEQTLLFVFSNGEEAEEAETSRIIGNHIATLIDAAGATGLSHSQLMNAVTGKGKRMKGDAKNVVKPAIERLLRESPPRIVIERVTTGGRPSLRYTAAKHPPTSSP